jgi:predicted aspartyl protease
MKTTRTLATAFVGRLLGALLLLSVSACQIADMARFSYANANATHQWTSAELTTTVPFTLIDNHIILPVRVNGSEPLNFVLDSGAAATVIIDSRATRALQLEMHGELPVSGVGTGPDPVAHIVPETDLAVGEVSLEGSSVIFLPLDSIPFFNDLDHVYFDGVIGAPFFTRFVVEIDYERRQVSFSEPSAAMERIGSLGDDWREVPLEIDAGTPYMTAQVAAGEGLPVDVKLLVDTGARGAVSLTPSTDDRLQAPLVYFPSVSDGLSGEVFNQVAMAESLSVAGYRLQRLPVSYATAGGEDENGSNGILGNEVLQQFNLVFDYSHERLFLVPNSNFAAPIEADRSGLQLRPHTAGGIVKRIAPDSTGQASPLQVGDIITRFDDNRVSHQNIRELKRALASGRDSVHLCWQSGAIQRCEDLTLASRF